MEDKMRIEKTPGGREEGGDSGRIKRSEECKDRMWSRKK